MIYLFAAAAGILACFCLLVLAAIAGHLRALADACQAREDREKAAHELARASAAAIADAQVATIKANLALIESTTKRLEAEAEHIAKCEERYAHALSEAEAVAGQVRLARKPKLH